MARANVTPIRLTGRLWKLRAWSMTVTLPTAIVDATFVKKMKVSGSIGPPPVLGSSRRKNSRTGARPELRAAARDGTSCA